MIWRRRGGTLSVMRATNSQFPTKRPAELHPNLRKLSEAFSPEVNRLLYVDILGRPLFWKSYFPQHFVCLFQFIGEQNGIVILVQRLIHSNNRNFSLLHFYYYVHFLYVYGTKIIIFPFFFLLKILRIQHFLKTFPNCHSIHPTLQSLP